MTSILIRRPVYIAMALASLVGGTAAIAVPAHAQVTTDRMSCSKVVATYERNGRIYIKSRTGQVLPIYGGVPLSRKNQLRCSRGSVPAGYRVKSSDKKRCVAMYKCS